jgi:hypothetical protein
MGTLSMKSGFFVSFRSLTLGLVLGGLVVAAGQTASAQMRTFGSGAGMHPFAAAAPSVQWVGSALVQASSVSVTCPAGTVVIGGGGTGSGGIVAEGADPAKNTWTVDTTIQTTVVKPYVSASAACLKP